MNLTKLQRILTHPILITDEKMIDYLIGQRFSTGERFLGLLISQSSVQLFLNNLFPCSILKFQIIRFSDTDDVIQILSKQLTTLDLSVDKNMRAEFLLRLMSLNPQLQVHIDCLADYVRSIKDVTEQQLMIESSKINDQVMSIVPSLLRVGISEIEVAMRIKELFIEQGSDAISFYPIVAFGNHASDPHAFPSDRKLQENEAIIIDMGGVKNGYCSDMTRTFFLRSNPMKAIYDVVKRANQAAEAMIKPGIQFKDIDLAARSVIEEAGYGEYFIHRTGHGIGRDVHEPYDVSATNERIVEEGMCFSIEPGIYIEGLGGVRIEDLVCVTKDSCLVLNHYSKDLEIL